MNDDEAYSQQTIAQARWYLIGQEGYHRSPESGDYTSMTHTTWPIA